MLTAKEKAELRDLLKRASPGPWRVINAGNPHIFPRVQLGPARPYEDNSGMHTPSVCINDVHNPDCEFAGASMPVFRATAELIAFLRNHAEDLL